MKTGFSLLEILHRENPVFITGMGLQCVKYFDFNCFIRDQTFLKFKTPWLLWLYTNVIVCIERGYVATIKQMVINKTVVLQTFVFVFVPLVFIHYHMIDVRIVIDLERNPK